MAYVADGKQHWESTAENYLKPVLHENTCKKSPFVQTAIE